jgi:hypothetical protein
LQEGIADDSEDEAEEGAQKEKMDTMINIEFEYYKSLKTLEITEGTTEKGVDAFSNP